MKPDESGLRCLYVTDLRKPLPAPTLQPKHTQFTRHFLRLTSGFDTDIPPNVNGKVYTPPVWPPAVWAGALIFMQNLHSDENGVENSN